MSPGVGGKERQATPSHGQTLIYWFLSTTQRTSILMPCLGHHPSLAPLLYSLEGQYSFLDVPSHLTHMPPEWSFQPSDLTTRAQDYCKIKTTCPMCSVPVPWEDMLPFPASEPPLTPGANRGPNPTCKLRLAFMCVEGFKYFLREGVKETHSPSKASEFPT